MPVIESPEYLEINFVPLYTPAWKITDHTPLMQAPDTVGRSRRIPGGKVLPFPRYATETVYELPMVIFGDVDQEGVVKADGRLGLRDNIDYLNSRIVTIGLPADGMHPAVWHFAGTRTARVHAALTLSSRKTVLCRAVLELTVPSGQFV